MIAESRLIHARDWRGRSVSLHPCRNESRVIIPIDWIIGYILSMIGAFVILLEMLEEKIWMR